MAFLDSLGATLTNMGNNVTSKTKSMVEVTNINGQIKSCEDQLLHYYIEIGKRYYSSHKDDPDVDEDIAEQFAKVKEANEAVGHLREALKKAKGTENCSQCGAELPIGTAFCPKCGFRMGSQAEEAEGDPKVCPKCGNTNKAGAAFCVDCGEKL